jgi:hypothetical protein
MKRIVNGVTYNTATATRVATASWTGVPGDIEAEVEGTLYQTRGGAFFVHNEITKEVWNEIEQRMLPRTLHEFEPMSREQASAWILDGDVEVFHNPFEDPPEAAEEPDGGATIYLRIPASLKARVEQMAEREDVSANTWAMRCLERCVSTAKRPSRQSAPRRR